MIYENSVLTIMVGTEFFFVARMTIDRRTIAYPESTWRRNISCNATSVAKRLVSSN